MVLGYSLLWAYVAEHIQLLLVFSTHAFFLSGCAVETREFRGTPSPSKRVFPHPAREAHSAFSIIGPPGLLMLCPACKTPVPGSELQCPACGTATPADDDATQMFVEENFAQGSADLTQATPEPRGWSKPFTPSDAIAYRRVSLAPGSVLGGRYEILKTLGEGGMGSVFKDHDKEVDRIVALKVIRPELAGRTEILQRFRQELVLAQQITHRNAVRIYDLSVADGVRFISMEYIEGQELREFLDNRGKLPAREAAEFMLQVCYGLAAAHGQGIVHRDLKPQNIMIDKQGRAAVMDFGLAGS